VPHLGLGGAQHVIATLARNLDKSKYEVHLGLVTQSSLEVPDLPPSVTVHCLGATRTRYSTIRLISLVHRIRPAVILSGMAHLNLLVLLLRPVFPRSPRIIVRQNGSVSAAIKAMGPYTLSRFLFGFGYRRADAIICQTHFTAEELRATLRLGRNQTIVLPNPVDIESIRACTSSREQRGAESCEPCLLAAGRLVPEKGFDLLIESFAQLKPDFPSLRLLISGSGPCLPALKAQCESLGVADQVDFPGTVAQPAQYFSHALAFVLSSRRDEMPNALLEAAAGGLPIVSTPASRGVSDLLRDQPGVWLAASISVDSLTHALRSALVATASQRRFNHQWIKPFVLKTAIAAYEAVTDKALTRENA
jgi:glycosyltransferase involved in cell wall biosynthesis